MKTTKLLVGAVLSLLGGLAMTSIASATAPVTVEQNGDLTVCGTEYVSDSNGAEGCITIQGKNVGATSTGAGPNAPDTSYGNYYQWGNNYGFPTTGSVTTDSAQTGCGLYDRQNPLNDSLFRIENSDYCETPNDNLWGGGSDVFDGDAIEGKPLNSYPVQNPTDRQGPCPTDYHVPSQGELYALVEMWAETGVRGGISGRDGYSISQFYTDFQIPFAGFRNYTNGSSEGQGDGASLWSSSSDPGGYWDAWDIDISEFNLVVGQYGYMDRAHGLPVRCFKDSPYSTSNLPSEGGDSEIIVNIAEFNGGQNTCSGSNYIFENIVAGTSTGTHTLSGVFQCAFGNGRSSSTVTLQLSGDLVADGDRVISGSNLMMKNSEWTVSPVGLKFADTLISTWKALTATQTLFQKTANLIGVASGVVEVQLTVPGGTPDGTYNGVLVLTY